MTNQTHHYGDDCQPPHRALEPCSSLVRVADDRCAKARTSLAAIAKLADDV